MRLKKKDARGRNIATKDHRFDLYFNEEDSPDIVNFLNSLTGRSRMNREMEIILAMHLEKQRRRALGEPELSEEDTRPSRATRRDLYAVEPEQNIVDDFGVPE